MAAVQLRNEVHRYWIMATHAGPHDCILLHATAAGPDSEIVDRLMDTLQEMLNVTMVYANTPWDDNDDPCFDAWTNGSNVYPVLVRALRESPYWTQLKLPVLWLATLLYAPFRDHILLVEDRDKQYPLKEKRSAKAYAILQDRLVQSLELWLTKRLLRSDSKYSMFVQFMVHVLPSVFAFSCLMCNGVARPHGQRADRTSQSVLGERHSAHAV